MFLLYPPSNGGGGVTLFLDNSAGPRHQEDPGHQWSFPRRCKSIQIYVAIRWLNGFNVTQVVEVWGDGPKHNQKPESKFRHN